MSRRILVIDDNVDSAELLALLLAKHGHETRHAHNASDALRAAIEFGPEVVILDIDLPESDGYEVAAMIRGTKTGGRCRFVALTGYAGDEVAAKSIASGFEAHVTKPIDAYYLLEVIAGHSKETGEAG